MPRRSHSLQATILPAIARLEQQTTQAPVLTRLAKLRKAFERLDHVSPASVDQFATSLTNPSPRAPGTPGRASTSSPRGTAVPSTGSPLPISPLAEARVTTPATARSADPADQPKTPLGRSLLERWRRRQGTK